MTHVPFASRIASFIGIPSHSTPQPDGRDDYYIPYTGTYEPPPASSSHAYTHTHMHSSSTNPAPSSYSTPSSHPHPYNPDRLVYLPDPSTPVDESERGRRKKTRPLSGSSSLAALSPSTESSGNVFPRTPPAVHPQAHPRRGGPSYLALDSGFIGQSPVAIAPPRETTRDSPAHRSSFTSFITFGNSRKSIGASSGSTSGPLSAQGLTFLHGTSKLRDELRMTADEDVAGTLAPPQPPFFRPRSKSYQDESPQGSALRRFQEEQDSPHHHRHQGREVGNTRGSVRVMMPSSFFDTTPFTELNEDPIRHQAAPSHPVPRMAHPYHQHYQPSLDPPTSAIDLASPPPQSSFNFLHPYAAAAGSSTFTTPTTHLRNVRPIIIPPKLGDRDHERDRAPHSAFPFVNPFSSKTRTPSPSRPATPKGRLKALIGLGESLKTLKSSTSTPNLRLASKGQQSNAPVTLKGPQGRTGAVATGTSRVPERSEPWVPPNSVLQGQTFYDTFFLPRPRLQAQPIGPLETPYSPAQQFSKLRPEPNVLIGGERDFTTGRRSTVAAIVQPGPSRGEPGLLDIKRLGKKKVSAPDLRKKPERPTLADMRTLTEIEKIIQLGAQSVREREEWANEGQRSFQNKRSRSFSRSRTKSVAKAATIATGGHVPDDPKPPPTGGEVNVPPGGGIISIPHTKSTAGSAPPTATSSSGDDSRTRERRKEAKEAKGLNVKTSVDYLAARAFSQGHTTTLSLSSQSHSRQQSGDIREKEQDEPRGHRRSESWGRTALKRAKSMCIDPEATSPAVEMVFESGEPRPPISKPAADNNILDIAPTRHVVRIKEPMSDTDSVPSGVGIAIGTPPLETLAEPPNTRIEHPYSSPLASPISRYAGPHPVSPSLPPALSLNDVVSRHRLPPRAAVPVSPTVSPSVKSNGLAELDGFVPTIETSHQAMLSRESWLIYMNAMEDGGERPHTADKGKRKPVEYATAERFHELYPEKVDETQLTKAFRHQSTDSLAGSEENEHADLTFEAGATLTRLLSSRSVTATPRQRTARTLSNPETPRGKKVELDPEDPERTLTHLPSTRPPIPTFASDVLPAPALSPTSTAAIRPSSGISEGPPASEHQNSWRKSIVSSEGHAQSPSSRESSPKASPRAMVNLDDLEGYNDLFYHSGGASTGGRPKSGGSFQTNSSGGPFRSGLINFGQKGGGASSSLIERSRSSPDQSWGRTSFATSSSKAMEPAWRVSNELPATWDDEEEDSYRIVSSRPPVLPISVAPIHRHSTKLSVIEGSIDEHATASESTGERDSLLALSPLSPTRPSMEGVAASSSSLPHIEKLSIPNYVPHRTSSEAAVANEGHARISMMTSTSGQSRMSGLSEFPIPPMETTALALTPSNILQAYFPPRQRSPDADPISPVSVEPPSSVGDGEDQEDMSVSEHHHHVITSAPRSYNSNRATFGPDTDMAKEWTEHLSAGTPLTEDE